MLQIGCDGWSAFHQRQFVGFCEDDGEGYAVFAAEVEEVDVFLLGFVAYVDEDKQTGQLFSVGHVVAYQVPEFVHFAFASLGIAVAW